MAVFCGRKYSIELSANTNRTLKSKQPPKEQRNSDRITKSKNSHGLFVEQIAKVVRRTRKKRDDM